MAPRHHRLLRGVAWGLGLLLGLPLTIVALVLLALAVPFTRAPLVQWGLGFANEALSPLRVELDRAARLDPWGIDLVGARLYDAKNRLLVSIDKAAFRLAPWELVGGTLHVESARIRGVRAHLYTDEEAPAPESEAASDSEPSTFQVNVDRLIVRDASLQTELAQRAVHAELAVLDAGAAYGPRTALLLRELSLRAEVDKQPALRLSSRAARWNEQNGGHVEISGTLLGARLGLTLDVPSFNEDRAWPVRKLRLDLEDLSAAGLARVGLQDAVGLKLPLSLHVDGHTEGENEATLRAALRVEGGPLDLRAEAEATKARAKVHLSLAPLTLARVSDAAPDMELGGEFDVTLTPALDPRKLAVSFRKLSLSGRAVPPGRLVLLRSGHEITLERLQFSGLESALSLRGAYDTQRGDADVTLTTHAFELARLGGLVPEDLRGRLDGRLRAHVSGSALRGQSDLTLHDFHSGTTDVREAELDLALSGSLSAPRGHVRLTARDVELAGEPIALVQLEADAGARDLRGKLSVHGKQRSLDLHIDGARAPSGKLTLHANGQGNLKGEPLGLSLSELTYADGALSVDDLYVFSGKEQLRLSLDLSRRERVEAVLGIQRLNLRKWTGLFMSQPIEGTLDLRAKARGALSLPSLWVELDLRGAKDTSVPRAPKVDAAARLVLDLSTHEAELTLGAHSVDKQVDVELKASAALPKRVRGFADAFTRAKLTLALDSHADLGFVAQFAGPPFGELAGALDANVQASGTLDAATLAAHLGAHVRPRSEQGAEDRVAFDAQLDAEAFDAHLDVRDRTGPLVDLAARVSVPPGGVRALLDDPEALRRAPAQLKLTLFERRLDRIEGALGLLLREYGAVYPVQVSAGLRADSDGQTITSDLSAKAHVWGKGLEVDCAREGELSAELDASLKNDTLQLALAARPRDSGALRIRAQAPVAVDALLAGGELSFGPAVVEGHGEALALSSLPTLCKLPSARTGFELAAQGVGEPDAKARLHVDMAQIQVPGIAGLELHMDAHADAHAASAEGTLCVVDGPQGSFRARVPLAYGESRVPELLMQRPIAADVRLPNFPVAALSAFTQALGRAKGSLDLGLAVRGTLEKPEPRGAIELNNAAFSIASLAQPFSGVDGRIELSPHGLTVKSLEAHDRDGKLAVQGYATYTAPRGGKAELHLSAERFPIRQQGSIVGELSTRAVLSGTLDTDNRLRLKLEIKEGRVWLTGSGGRDVQSLDEHPDIRYASEQATSDEDEAPAENTDISLASLKIESERDLWLMHEDFSVQVGVQIELTTEGEHATLQGQATITRGDLNLLGKPFRIEKGAVRFTGDTPPDPELDLKAKHTTRQGQTLIVQIQGRSSAPEILFSGAANNAGEAAMLLSGIGASGADSKAKSDAASFAAGLTAGLLAVSARRRFGDWVPMLAIENNAQGAPSGARAGFDASRLIPDFMQGFARGMYVEGVVGSRTDTASRGVGVGVRVELSLPRDFMTSMGYGPGTVWSTDVYWSP